MTGTGNNSQFEYMHLAYQELQKKVESIERKINSVETTLSHQNTLIRDIALQEKEDWMNEFDEN